MKKRVAMKVVTNVFKHQPVNYKTKTINKAITTIAGGRILTPSEARNV